MSGGGCESVFPGNADIDPLPNTATDQHAQQKSRRRCRGTYTYVECAPSNENEKESLILEGNSCRRLLGARLTVSSSTG